MALKSNGSTFLDDNRNYSATANTALANDAYILIANNDSVSSDGYSISDTKAIADDGFAFNQFNAEEQVISFSPPPPTAYGSVSGYTSGGSPANQNNIDKFSFASDGNATDVGDLTQSRGGAGGTSSSESGYTAGGGTYGSSWTPNRNTVDKFPFAADANATDVGNLTDGRGGVRGITGVTHGYSSGGGIPAASSIIDKFPFASDANATDVGDLSIGTTGDAGNGSSSEIFGYHAGLSPSFNDGTNRIEKFPFASDANATDVGDLTQIRNGATGQSSDVSGYTSGGFTQPGANERNTIDKFPFASDANATDVGDLTEARKASAGQSSTTSGYTSGNKNHPADPGNIIDKFPFASDANATDVGDLTRLTKYAAGQQV